MPSRNLPIISRLAILCGGFEAQFGWVFFGFGMIFFWIFFMNSEIIHWFTVGNTSTARETLFGWEVIFVVIFPLVGLIFILYSFRQNIKSVDLLINGRFTHGKLIKTEPTNVTINKQTVYKYTFRFEAHDGKMYEAVGKTHIYSLLTDEKNERLIYAPNDPSYATMYDSIPSAPKLNEDGSLGPMPLSGYGNMILPLISIFFHGGYYLIRYVL